MKLGVEWLYQYTDACKLSFNAFLHRLEGLMVPSDMPQEVMRGVIERAEATAIRIDAEDTNAKRTRKQAGHTRQAARALSVPCGGYQNTKVLRNDYNILIPQRTSTVAQKVSP